MPGRHPKAIASSKKLPPPDALTQVQQAVHVPYVQMLSRSLHPGGSLPAYSAPAQIHEYLRHGPWTDKPCAMTRTMRRYLGEKVHVRVAPICADCLSDHGS